MHVLGLIYPPLFSATPCLALHRLLHGRYRHQNQTVDQKLREKRIQKYLLEPIQSVILIRFMLKKSFQGSTRCSLNIVFFPRILESLPPPTRQHLAAIGCTKITSQ